MSFLIYIHFIDFTKNVPNGGNITQNHSGLKIRKRTMPAKDKSV